MRRASKWNERCAATARPMSRAFISSTGGAIPEPAAPCAFTYAGRFFTSRRKMSSISSLSAITLSPVCLTARLEDENERRPLTTGPSRRPSCEVLGDRDPVLLVRDHLAARDQRPVGKCALELLLTHPSLGNASRLLGLSQRLEQADRRHDAVTCFDQVVAAETRQLAQARQERLVDLLAQLLGATGVNTLVAPYGGMH